MKFLDCNAITGPLTALTESNCMVLLGQAKRLGYQTIPAAEPLGTETTVLAQATYTAAMAKSDDSKLVLPRPKLYAPELGGSEAVKVGSNDNTTPDGRSIIRGQSVPRFSARYTGLTPTQYGEFETLFARGNSSADFDTLGFYGFLGDRQVIMTKDFRPIAMHSLFIGDPTGMQLHDLTQFMIEFELEKGWYRDAFIATLNFNHNLL